MSMAVYKVISICIIASALPYDWLSMTVQVEAVSDVVVEAQQLLTASQEVEIADKLLVCGRGLLCIWNLNFSYHQYYWDQENTSHSLVASKSSSIHVERAFPWKATQYNVILSLCKAGFRTQAVQVFKDTLVDFVAPIQFTPPTPLFNVSFDWTCPVHVRISIRPYFVVSLRISLACITDSICDRCHSVDKAMRVQTSTFNILSHIHHSQLKSISMTGTLAKIGIDLKICFTEAPM
jgi:hypothetical protein